MLALFPLPASPSLHPPLPTAQEGQPRPQVWWAIGVSAHDRPSTPTTAPGPPRQQQSQCPVLSPCRPNTQGRERHPKSQASAPASPPLLTRKRPLPGCSWGRPLAWAGEHANLNANYMQIQGLPLSSWHPPISAACGSPHSGLLPPEYMVLRDEKALRGGGSPLSCFKCPPKYFLRDPDGGKNLPAWSCTPKNKTFSEYPPSLQRIHKQNHPPPGPAGDHASHRMGFLKPWRR